MNPSSAIVINNFFDKYNKEPNIFNALPELDFIPPLAQKIKAKGCTCGLGGELNEATTKLNEVVSNLNEEQVARFTVLLKVEKLCFGILTKEGFTTKCY